MYMIKTAIDDLHIGDEVLKFDRGWLSTDFLSHRVMVSDKSIIERFRSNGIQFVYIKPRSKEIEQINELVSGKSDEIISIIKQEAPKNQINLKDFNLASEVYSESVKIIGNVLGDVKSGKMFNVGAVKHVAENITEMTIRHRGVLASITKLKKHDDYTFRHSMNVSIFAASLAAHLGLNKQDISIAANAGLMHDIGKMLVPDEILNKPGRLSEKEYDIMKSHVEKGYEFLKADGTQKEYLCLVREHHERHDGSGYPFGLKDSEISIHGKIGAVVDIYDAITSDRVYRKGMLATEVLKMMFQWTDKHINKSVFEFFIKNIGIYPVGSIVMMASQELAMVGRINHGRPTDPTVIVFTNKSGNFQPIKVVDLSKSGIDRQKIVGLINPDNVKVPDDVLKYVDNLNRMS